MNVYRLFPSLPAQSFNELKNLIDTLSDLITEIQVDISDGKFSPHISWPFNTKNSEESLLLLSSATNNLKVEIDCMVKNPEQYFPIFYELQVARVVLHYGTTDKISSAINDLHQHGIKAGLAFTSDTKPKDIFDIVREVDFVQIMGIAVVGEQGHPFDERSLGTIEQVRSEFPDIDIAVDGSVNEKTIPRLKQAGANVFLPGSAISRSDNPKEAYRRLQALLRG